MLCAISLYMYCRRCNRNNCSTITITITTKDLLGDWESHASCTISTLSLTTAVTFSDQQSTGPASYHAATIWIVTRVSLPLIRVCGTVCHRTYDETLATDDLSKNWKHFYSAINWPRHIVTVSYYVCTLEIFFLTYLLIYKVCLFTSKPLGQYKFGQQWTTENTSCLGDDSSALWRLLFVVSYTFKVFFLT